MKSEIIAGMGLYYDPEEQEAARVIGVAMEKSAALFSQRWGLAPPRDCRVYVMTSWLRFLFQSAPWAWKVYLILVLPLLTWRANETWAVAGGWSLQFGQRRVVGVKPARFLKKAHRGPGEPFYAGDMELDEKVQTITCHELAHAYTFHLGLPTWLHEGLATRAMEHYLGRQTVREETLAYLTRPSVTASKMGTKKARVRKPQALLAQYALGYWLTRYIEETRPTLLKALLSQRMPRKELEEQVAAAFGKTRESFWQEIGEELRSYFGVSVTRMPS